MIPTCVFCHISKNSFFTKAGSSLVRYGHKVNVTENEKHGNIWDNLHSSS